MNKFPDFDLPKEITKYCNDLGLKQVPETLNNLISKIIRIEDSVINYHATYCIKLSNETMVDIHNSPFGNCQMSGIRYFNSLAQYAVHYKLNSFEFLLLVSFITKLFGAEKSIILIDTNQYFFDVKLNKSDLDVKDFNPTKNYVNLTKYLPLRFYKKYRSTNGSAMIVAAIDRRKLNIKIKSTINYLNEISSSVKEIQPIIENKKL